MNKTISVYLGLPSNLYISTEKDAEGMEQGEIEYLGTEGAEDAVG